MGDVSESMVAALKGEPAPEPAPADTAPVTDPAPVDTAPETPPAEASPQEPDPKFAAKFAALSKQERQLREARDKFKAEQQAFESSQKEAQEYRDALERFKSDPVGMLEWLGKKQGVEDPYDFITEAKINGGKPGATQEVKELKARLDAMEAERKRLAEETEKAKEQAQQQRHVDEFKGTIREHIEATKEEAELCHAFDRAEYVYSVVESHYSETGEVLPVEEAVKRVEDALQSEWRGIVEKLLTAPKTKSALLELIATKEPSVLPSKPRVSKTLTNKQASTAPPRSEPKGLLSREESLERAAATLRGETP